MAFFGLKLGLDLEMRAAHPHQKFQGVLPPPVLQRLHFHIKTLDKVASGEGSSRVPETILVINKVVSRQAVYQI